MGGGRLQNQGVMLRRDRHLSRSHTDTLCTPWSMFWQARHKASHQTERLLSAHLYSDVQSKSRCAAAGTLRVARPI